ncbi:MAG: ATP-dependent helicase, partial [Cyanobacteria bacterium P01_H01_bin.58]
MAILHGSWLAENQSFFLWGEIWQRLETDKLTAEPAIKEHPFGMTIPPLLDSLKAIGGLPKSFWVEAAIAPKKGRSKAQASQRHLIQLLSLPTCVADTHYLPKHSADTVIAENETVVFHPWQIAGVWLTPLEAAAFLESLPLGHPEVAGTVIGQDLRYWSHVARWGLDLLARGKYLPAITLPPNKTPRAYWRLLLDSDVDAGRLRLFTQVMPLSCRTYEPVPKVRKGTVVGLSMPFPTIQEPFLCSFLEALVDAQVRAQAESVNTSAEMLSPDLPIQAWLQALSGNVETVDSSAIAAARLRDALHRWAVPLQNSATDRNRFRVCFQLVPPKDGQGDWRLVYALQSRDDEA